MLRRDFPLDRAGLHAEGERGQGFIGQAVSFLGSVRRPLVFIPDHGDFRKPYLLAPSIHSFEVLVSLGLFTSRVGEQDTVRAYPSIFHLQEHGGRIHSRPKGYDERLRHGLGSFLLVISWWLFKLWRVPKVLWPVGRLLESSHFTGVDKETYVPGVFLQNFYGPICLVG